jgi:cellulose biosynthesis protein BcsQ
MQNTIHFVLQAKGGIGKSFVSTLLAQYCPGDRRRALLRYRSREHHVYALRGAERAPREVANQSG